jgi:hypothetical protein
VKSPSSLVELEESDKCLLSGDVEIEAEGSLDNPRPECGPAQLERIGTPNNNLDEGEKDGGAVSRQQLLIRKC